MDTPAKLSIQSTDSQPIVNIMLYKYQIVVLCNFYNLIYTDVNFRAFITCHIAGSRDIYG